MNKVTPDHHLLSLWLHEDIGSGDLTADIIPDTIKAHGTVQTREEMVLCGKDWFTETLRLADTAVDIDWYYEDGDKVMAGAWLCRFKGKARQLLSAERTALNLLQTMSATASIASLYANAVKGIHVKLLDTRKTIPGLRAAQKYAVMCGGCHNHRHGLYDAILIKENHIAVAGSVGNAIEIARKLHPNVLLEVEVETMEELEQALFHGCKRILLDNFCNESLRRAVQFTKGRAELEASGNINLDNIREIAATGVDYISIGALTKNVRAIDLSMRLEIEHSHEALPMTSFPSTQSTEIVSPGRKRP